MCGSRQRVNGRSRWTLAEKVGLSARWSHLTAVIGHGLLYLVERRARSALLEGRAISSADVDGARTRIVVFIRGVPVEAYDLEP